MIEVNVTEPVEASLTLVLRGKDVHNFKYMIDDLLNDSVDGYTKAVAAKIREALS